MDKVQIVSHRATPDDRSLEVVRHSNGSRNPGQSHAYYSISFYPCGDTTGRIDVTVLSFWQGYRADPSINGITSESLLAVVIDRLQGFQAQGMACRENAIALTHLETAMLWLHQRTRERQAQEAKDAE